MSATTPYISPEFRHRLIAAAKRGLNYRSERIMEWRVLLFTIHWWLSGKQPEWHAFFDCPTCHPWASVPWVGPYDLGAAEPPKPKAEDPR